MKWDDLTGNHTHLCLLDDIHLSLKESVQSSSIQDVLSLALGMEMEDKGMMQPRNKNFFHMCKY